MVDTEAQLLLEPQLPVLSWTFKERVPSTHHASDATWSKWITLVIQHAQVGNPSPQGILQVIMCWPKGNDFGILPEKVMHAEEAPLNNKVPE